MQPEEPVSQQAQLEQEPVDHEPLVEEPAKPEGELVQVVESVEQPTADPQPEPEVIVQEEEETEKELIDGGENQANLFLIYHAWLLTNAKFL